MDLSNVSTKKLVEELASRKPSTDPVTEKDSFNTENNTAATPAVRT